MGDEGTHYTDSGVDGERGAVDDKQLRITMSITKQTQFPLRRKPHSLRPRRGALQSPVRSDSNFWGAQKKIQMAVHTARSLVFS